MKKEVIAHKDPKAPISEIFRTLRTNIQFMNANGNSKKILITSTFAGEGKSWVSANLAVTFAQTGQNVLIIDADMRKGRQYAVWGISPKPGLSNYLSGVNIYGRNEKSRKITDYIQRTEVDNLYVMTAGNIPPNPSELLISTKMYNLLEEANDMFDVIIIDGTPSQLVTDSLILARVVDATVIVTAYGKTRKEDLKRVIDNIKNVGGKITGVVFNKVPVPSKKYYQSYYYGSNSLQPTNAKNGKELSTYSKINVEDMNIDPEIIKENQIKPNIYREEKINNTENNGINNNTNIENAGSNMENKMYGIGYNNGTDTNQNNINYQASSIAEESNISLEKTNKILEEINQYIDREKKNLQ